MTEKLMSIPLLVSLYRSDFSASQFCIIRIIITFNTANILLTELIKCDEQILEVILNNVTFLAISII